MPEGQNPSAARAVNSPDHAAAAELLVHTLSVHRPQERGLGLVIRSPLRVLIADDYADAALSLAMLLSYGGADTKIAMNGTQALAQASHWQPHVCVLDITMPGLDGWEIARRIREQVWAERPLLIALSGWTRAEHRRLALEAGFDHYLTKPAEGLKLARIIQAHYASCAAEQVR